MSSHLPDVWVTEMATVLGYRCNVDELLEILDLIASRKFEALPNAWREQTTRSVAYHGGQIGRGGNLLYYYPWCRRKIDAQAAKTRTDTIGVVPDHGFIASVHVENDLERTRRQPTYDHVPVLRQNEGCNFECNEYKPHEKC